MKSSKYKESERKYFCFSAEPSFFADFPGIAWYVKEKTMGYAAYGDENKDKKGKSLDMRQ
jgi:hypothetical protein